MTLDEAADAFARRHLGTTLDALPTGSAGIVRLAEAIDAWCDIEEPGDEADRAFVEGAGALLGVLLIAHVGDGAHVSRDGAHRVRLGPRGWFDPFRAIEEVLDADDPRAALADRVREAEAEARDRGRTSRVLYAIERLLEPPSRVAEHFEHYVRLEPAGELDIARVVAATEGEPDAAVEQAVARLVGMLRGTEHADVPWDEARARLVPRLVSRAMLEELGSALFASPLGHEVALTLLLRYEDRARYVREAEARAWEADAVGGGIVRAAIENLAARSGSARFARVDTDAGPIVIARTGDGLDAARLVLPSLHAVLAPELGSPFLAAVPHRDTLLAAPRGPASIVGALRARAADEAARAPHGISGGLFEIDARGMRAVD